MRNILFFGATGKLGRIWIKSLIKNNKIYANLYKKKILEKNKNFSLIKFNLKKTDPIFEFCKKKKITMIINCVGLSDVELSQKKSHLAKELNYYIPIKLCKIAKKMRISFIHISTDMLFDGKSSKKYDENSRYFALNNYSKTKINAEKNISLYEKSLIVRTNFFGIGTKENPTFSDNILNTSSNKKIKIWKNIFFNPVYLSILIKILNQLIKNNLKGIYQISSNQCISKYILGKKILKKFKSNKFLIPTNFNKKKFTNRPLNMCLSNNKLLKKFPNLRKKLNIEYQLNLYKREISKNEKKN